MVSISVLYPGVAQHQQTPAQQVPLPTHTVSTVLATAHPTAAGALISSSESPAAQEPNHRGGTSHQLQATITQATGAAGSGD